MAGDNEAFIDLPEEIFPFTVRIFDNQTDEMLQETVVDGPGAFPIAGYPDRHVRVEIYDKNDILLERGFGESSRATDVLPDAVPEQRDPDQREPE